MRLRREPKVFILKGDLKIMTLLTAVIAFGAITSAFTSTILPKRERLDGAALLVHLTIHHTGRIRASLLTGYGKMILKRKEHSVSTFVMIKARQKTHESSLDPISCRVILL